MHRILRFLAFIVVLAAGCSGGSTAQEAEPESTTTIVTSSTLPSATSPAAPTVVVPLPDADRTITVTGKGTAYGVPDTLSAELVVTVLRPVAEDAVAVTADVAANMRAALLAAGVDPSDIQSSDYTMHSEYDYSGRARIYEGIRVRHAFRVKLDVDQAGSTIDKAISASWDALEVSGTWLFLKDDSDLRVESRAAAWEDCLATAEEMAANAGTSLGDLVSLTVHGAYTSPLSQRPMGGNGGGDSGTEFEPGRVVATTDLTAVFLLES